MNDLSSYLLDIMFNCIEAKCKNIKLIINEDINNNLLEIFIEDDGIGMTKEQVRRVIDPFYTSRNTRKVGLGIPFYKELCELCGGTFRIESQKNVGTSIFSTMQYNAIDLPDLGYLHETICSIIINDDVDLFYQHKYNNRVFIFDTKEIKKILKEVPITNPQIIKWIKDYVRDELIKVKVNI